MPSTLSLRAQKDPNELPKFELPLIPEHVNERLTRFFLATRKRQRIYRLLLALLRHHSIRTANAVAFDLFLALVPLLALAGWTVSHLISQDPAAIASSSLLLDVTPHEFHSFIEENFLALSASNLAPLAMISGWWLSSSAFFTLFAVFEETFDGEPRPYWQTTFLSMGFALCAFALVSLSAAAGVFFTIELQTTQQHVLQSIVGSGAFSWIVGGAGFVIISSFIALIYRYGVHRPKHERSVWPGAFLASILGGVASIVFGYYVTNIARFALFYGGLAAVAITLLGLWLWCTAILIGAEVNVMLEDLKKIPDTQRSTSAPAYHD